MRWPLLPSLHPRRWAQDLVAPGVEPGFALAQSSVEKQCIFVCARVAGYNLPPIYLVGGFGVAGKLEIFVISNLSYQTRCYSYPFIVSRGSTLKVI